VGSGVWVAVGVGVSVWVGRGVWVGVGVNEGVGEWVGVCVGATVAVGCGVGLGVGECVGVCVGAAVAVGCGVSVGVGEWVAVCVCASSAAGAPSIIAEAMRQEVYRRLAFITTGGVLSRHFVSVHSVEAPASSSAPERVPRTKASVSHVEWISRHRQFSSAMPGISQARF
jgi:hypothetical protein